MPKSFHSAGSGNSGNSGNRNATMGNFHDNSRGTGEAGGRGGFRNGVRRPASADADRAELERRRQRRKQAIHLADAIDKKMGFPRIDHGPPKVGWLVNMHSVCKQTIKQHNEIDFYWTCYLYIFSHFK